MEEAKNRDQQRNHLLSYMTHLGKLTKEMKSGGEDTDGVQNDKEGEEAE